MMYDLWYVWYLYNRRILNSHDDTADTIDVMIPDKICILTYAHLPLIRFITKRYKEPTTIIATKVTIGTR